LDGRIGFIIFYIAFLGILLTMMAYIPLTMISGISQTDLDKLLNKVDPPLDPNVLEALIYQFQVGLTWFTNFFLLMGATSNYKFIALILTPLTTGFIACVYSLIRSG
jgi:hypothetical protein